MGAEQRAEEKKKENRESSGSSHSSSSSSSGYPGPAAPARPAHAHQADPRPQHFPMPNHMFQQAFPWGFLTGPRAVDITSSLHPTMDIITRSTEEGGRQAASPRSNRQQRHQYQALRRMVLMLPEVSSSNSISRLPHTPTPNPRGGPVHPQPAFLENLARSTTQYAE